MVSEFGRVSERRKVRVNISKTRVIRFGCSERQVIWSYDFEWRELGGSGVF